MQNQSIKIPKDRLEPEKGRFKREVPWEYSLKLIHPNNRELDPRTHLDFLSFL